MVRVQLQDAAKSAVTFSSARTASPPRPAEQLFPAVQPAYSGYIGWRGTVPAASVEPRLCDSLGSHITYQLLDSGHILAYPIPDFRHSGSDRAVSLNWIWYRRVDAPHLARTMTDSQGRPHALSVPPGAVASDLVDELRAAAATLLSRDLAELVLATPQPFIQRVVDIEVPRMVSGRVCLLGDAAFVARPHAAAGTAKAVDDGWALAAGTARVRDGGRSVAPVGAGSARGRPCAGASFA